MLYRKQGIRFTICRICLKEHKIKLSLKNKILNLLPLAGIPAIGIFSCLFAKIMWCVILLDNQCWSHFP